MNTGIKAGSGVGAGARAGAVVGSAFFIITGAGTFTGTGIVELNKLAGSLTFFENLSYR